MRQCSKELLLYSPLIPVAVNSASFGRSTSMLWADVKTRELEAGEEAEGKLVQGSTQNMCKGCHRGSIQNCVKAAYIGVAKYNQIRGVEFI